MKIRKVYRQTDGWTTGDQRIGFFFSKVILKLTYTVVCQQLKQKKVKEVMEDYFY